MRLLLKWLLCACALLLLAQLGIGLRVTSLSSALAAVLTIGLLNLFVRPVLVLLTLPATLLTLGLFLFVINAVLFWVSAELLAGVHVRGFFSALAGSLLYTLSTLLIDSTLERLFSQK